MCLRIVLFYFVAAVLSYLKIHSFFPRDYCAVNVDGNDVDIDESDVAVADTVAEVEKYALYAGDSM